MDLGEIGVAPEAQGLARIVEFVCGLNWGMVGTIVTAFVAFTLLLAVIAGIVMISARMPEARARQRAIQAGCLDDYNAGRELDPACQRYINRSFALPVTNK